MAKYTIELREIVESGRNIFPFAYDFYDEAKRAKFERDFIRHFYFREIGCETIDRFIFNLEDKMQTVFPVYNEMLKAGEIEYKILDNYYLSETTKRTVESQGKSNGVSSTVGQTFDEQQTDTAETRKGSGTNEQSETNTTETAHLNTSETLGTGKESTDTATLNTDSSEMVKNETGSNATVSNNVVEGDSTKTSDNSSASIQKTDKKFLDTPQGLTDLSDSKYLTSLNQDIDNNVSENSNKETANEKQNTTGISTSETDTNISEKVDSKKQGISATETSTENTNTAKTNDLNATSGERSATEKSDITQSNVGNVNFKGEQKTTADNNTRMTNDNKSFEETEIIHKGNVGVESDAVMIQKHLKLQQLIAKTFQMFFDECEDLFMGVY